MLQNVAMLLKGGDNLGEAIRELKFFFTYLKYFISHFGMVWYMMLTYWMVVWIITQVMQGQEEQEEEEEEEEEEDGEEEKICQH